MNNDNLDKSSNEMTAENFHICLPGVKHFGAPKLSEIVDLQFYLAVDHVCKSNLQIEYEPPKEMVSDLFNMNFQIRKFESLVSILRNFCFGIISLKKTLDKYLS